MICYVSFLCIPHVCLFCTKILTIKYCILSEQCHNYTDYYLRQREYIIIVVCLSVCLSVGNFVQKFPKWICMKFLGKVGNEPVNKWLNFCGDLDHQSVSQHW